MQLYAQHFLETLFYKNTINTSVHKKTRYFINLSEFLPKIKQYHYFYINYYY